MSKLIRYGRKIPLPSTAEIKHELRLMAAGETLTHSASADDRALIVQDLACKHGISEDRAWMLVDRFGIGQS